MQTNFPALTAFAVLVAAGGVRADDKDKFQGSWKVEKSIRAGKPETFKSMTWDFKGNEFVFYRDGEINDSGKLTLGMDKKLKTIDYRSDLLPEEPIKGIYEIDGDTLRLCFAIEGERPKKFESAEGSTTMLIVLKRMKK